MNINYVEELHKLSKHRTELAVKYSKCRAKYGKLKAELDIIYASKIKTINEIKRNSGYETGLLILLWMMPELNDTYREMIEMLHNYKALQRLLDSVESEIQSIKAMMRYNIDGENGRFDYVG